MPVSWIRTVVRDTSMSLLLSRARLMASSSDSGSGCDVCTPRRVIAFENGLPADGAGIGARLTAGAGTVFCATCCSSCGTAWAAAAIADDSIRLKSNDFDPL